MAKCALLQCLFRHNGTGDVYEEVRVIATMSQYRKSAITAITTSLDLLGGAGAHAAVAWCQATGGQLTHTFIQPDDNRETTMFVNQFT